MPTIDQPANAYAAAPTGSQHFEDLLNPHLATIALVARRFAPSAEADDVAQEALLAAWRYRARFDPRRGTFRAWLLAIVMTEARKATGRRWRRSLLEASLKGRAYAEQSPPADDNPAFDALARAISGLSRRQREVVGLFYFVDLPIEEVAAILDLAPGTVKSTLAASRDRIRRELRGDD